MTAANIAIPPSVSYLCLQVSTEGQASFAHVHEIIDGLRRRGCAVELFEPAIGNRPPVGIAEKLWSFATVQLRLWRHSRNCDAIYIRAHPLALPTLLWARIVGIPVVSELNSTYEDIFSIYPWTRLFRPLVHAVGYVTLAGSDAIVTVSDGLRRWVLDKVPGHGVHVVPNGANVEAFRPLRGKTGSAFGTYILFFGAMSPWQGIRTLLAAATHPAWPEDVQLVFVGDGVLRPEIESAAQDNGRVRHLGRKPYLELANYIGDALAAVSPQTGTQEGVDEGSQRKELRAHFSPLKMYETLACGVPMIVSDFPGQAELVRRHSCGIVVPPSDPAAIAAAVKELAANPSDAQAMGERGRVAVVREHSWQHRADETLSVIHAVIHRRG